jgi:MFS family permease
MVVSINLPFLLGEYGYDSGVAGVVTSIFFLAMMLPGFFINRLVDIFGRNILLWGILLIALGLIDVFYNRSLLFVIIGCVATGFGYGMAQPYVYDKTSALASPQRVTYALALLMSMNYVAIVIAPFVVDWVQDLLGVKGERFPFAFNAVLGFVAVLVLVFINIRKKRREKKYE